MVLNTPRLVATDLDGTLLGNDGLISPRTRRALDALDAAGVTVVFVTGRPIRWMERLWEHVGGHGIAICSNGGIVYDVTNHQVLTARTLPRKVGLEVADRIRAAAPGSLFALETIEGFVREPRYSPHGDDEQRTDLKVGALGDYFLDDVVKMLALDRSAEPTAYWAAVESAVGHLVTTTWSSVGPLVEMSAAGVTKATTLELWCSEQGIDAADVVAFGDMPNDVAMLEWAGRSYAMENGHESAKVAASARAPSNAEDGVAQVLETLFGL